MSARDLEGHHRQRLPVPEPEQLLHGNGHSAQCLRQRDGHGDDVGDGERQPVRLGEDRSAA